MTLLLSVALLLSVSGSDVSDTPLNDDASASDVSIPAEPPYGVWDRLAACESTSRWHVATGNGYFGGLQMDMTFWRRHGGLAFAARADLASRAQQIAVAERGLAVQGWTSWPVCSRVIGVR